jgi:hypothetical protein
VRGGWAWPLVRRRVAVPHRRRAATAWRLPPVLRRCDGQSSVELLGAIPLLLIVVLAAAELLAAGAARVSASSAADAAAMALLQGGDAAAAARSAASGWARPRIAVHVSGRHVRVRLTPPSLVPGLSRLLSTTAEADAGPTPQVSSSP